MSKIEVNTVEPQCGTTLTLGACGQTVALGSGASQTGFGRTGTVDWITTPQTGTVTAATGKGYFVNTTSGGITVNLPAGAANSIVAVSDYASTAASNQITVAPNGSEKINGVNDNYIISTAGLAVTLVYVDGVRGWKSVTGSDADATGSSAAYVAACVSGACNTLTTVCSDYKVAKFVGPGNFTVSCAGNGAGSNTVDYLVIAGGGGAGGNNPSAYADGAGGGGGGGARMSSGTASGCYAASPLGSGVAALPVTATAYPIVVGAGGSVGSGPNVSRGNDGGVSTFSTICSAGGGGGGTHSSACTPTRVGNDGGSGGAPGGGFVDATSFGAGNTPPVSPAQGQNGAAATSSPDNAGGGGGGAVGVGLPGGPSRFGCGGIGVTNVISSVSTAYSGGGGGSAGPPIGSNAGFGGVNPGGTPGDPQAARGGAGNGVTPGCGTAGTINTGGGGGAGAKGNLATSVGGTGGSGIVYIRYKFQ